MLHYLDFSDLSLPGWESLYQRFDDMLAHPDDYRDAARGRAMASLFYEPSTRTNFSFQAAMLRLGGGVFSMNDPAASSAAKGETLKDTVIMCSGYADAVVLRHPREGAALAASLYSRVPVINAGDGGHLHPTQTLADLATLTRLRGGVGGMSIGFCGDLKNGRTVHSLIRALCLFPDISFHFISPPALSIPAYLRESLRAQGKAFVEVTALEDTLPYLDVLYMTRVQKERFADPAEYARYRGIYILTGAKLALARRELVVLHPLPRVDEISHEVDADPRAAYFEQARLGMVVRMALLLRLFEEGTRPLTMPSGEQPTAHVCRNPRCITRTDAYLPATVKDGACAYCEEAAE